MHEVARGRERGRDLTSGRGGLVSASAVGVGTASIADRVRVELSAVVSVGLRVPADTLAAFVSAALVRTRGIIASAGRRARVERDDRGGRDCGADWCGVADAHHRDDAVAVSVAHGHRVGVRQRGSQRGRTRSPGLGVVAEDARGPDRAVDGLDERVDAGEARAQLLEVTQHDSDARQVVVSGPKKQVQVHQRREQPAAHGDGDALPQRRQRRRQQRARD